MADPNLGSGGDLRTRTEQTALPKRLKLHHVNCIYPRFGLAGISHVLNDRPLRLGSSQLRCRRAYTDKISQTYFAVRDKDSKIECEMT
ncbi:hypothetical protein DSO57_1037219 [Entomophthora muscae]|uniref:Uncharacterized protein n=1 Tax=Entomophthora muscae TaxID=34485 RepID=A0ACC2SZ21_9FUNG|nr:hypothetical protein DSO57_1037219 [Entomophthora muscae]